MSSAGWFSAGLTWSVRPSVDWAVWPGHSPLSTWPVMLWEAGSGFCTWRSVGLGSEHPQCHFYPFLLVQACDKASPRNGEPALVERGGGVVLQMCVHAEMGSVLGTSLANRPRQEGANVSEADLPGTSTSIVIVYTAKLAPWGGVDVTKASRLLKPLNFLLENEITMLGRMELSSAGKHSGLE